MLINKEKRFKQIDSIKTILKYDKDFCNKRYG